MSFCVEKDYKELKIINRSTIAVSTKSNLYHNVVIVRNAWLKFTIVRRLAKLKAIAKHEHMFISHSSRLFACTHCVYSPSFLLLIKSNNYKTINHLTYVKRIPTHYATDSIYRIFEKKPFCNFFKILQSICTENNQIQNLSNLN